MCLQCWQLVGLRKTWSWKQWLTWGRAGDRLREVEGEWEAMDGLGEREGEREGERRSTPGGGGEPGGEGSAGSAVMKSGGRRASL